MFGMNPFGPPPGGAVTLGWIYPPQWYSSIDIQNQTANLFSALLNDAGVAFMDIGSGPGTPAMVVDPIGEGTFVSDGTIGFPIQDVAGTLSSNAGTNSFMSCSQTSPTTFAIEKVYQDNGVSDMAWAVFSQQMRP
jgi:hypothetical protein